MNKVKKLKIEGIQKIDLTFGGAVKLCRANGNPDIEEFDWEDEIIKLLNMPEEEIPDRFSIELEVTGDDRHFLLAKACGFPVVYGMDDERPLERYDNNWFMCDGVRDDYYPGGWDVVEQDCNPRFDQAYFNFLFWIYEDKVRDLQWKRKLSDEVAYNMLYDCITELNKIWETFMAKKVRSVE